MQTTRPVLAETAERRAAPPPAPPARRSRRTRYFVLLGVAVLVTSVVGTGWVLNGSHAGDAPVQGRVSEDADFVVGFGHVDVESRVINLYPAQPGKVVEVPEKVKENALLEKGETIFRVDDSLAKLRVLEAEADLKAAEARLEQAKEMPAQHDELIRQQQAAVEAMKFERARADALFQKADRLFASTPPLVSKEDRDAAHETVKKADEGIKIEEAKLQALKLHQPQLRLDVERAESDVAAKASRLEQAKYVRDECVLKAPCRGMVLRLLVNVGDTLGPQPKEPAVIFCPDQPRIIRAEVEQEFAGKVKLDMPAVIQDDARVTGEWRGKVKRISDWYLPRRSVLLEPRQFNDVRTLECIIELDDATGLRIGQRVRVILGK